MFLSATTILCSVTLALVFARANVFAQDVQVVGNKTLSSVYYADPEIIRLGLDSVLRSHHLTSESVRINGDSIASELLRVLAKPQTGVPIASVIIKHLWALQEVGCPDCEGVLRRSSLQYVMVEGVIAFDEIGKPTIPFNFYRFGSFSQEHALMLNVSKPSEAPKSFWESTAQPILVTLGAAAIIALFFLIRS